MNLLTYKWTTALVILAISLISGFASLKLVSKYQRHLQVGDAAANGIFIGAALFHLIPDAHNSFAYIGSNSPWLYTIALAFLSFLFLFGIDRIAYHFSSKSERMLSVGLLTITLSIHAFTTGAALGLSESVAMVSIIFFAIIAHKAFEMFAFVFQLHRRLQNYYKVMIIYLLFSLVTPVGIWIGSESSQFFDGTTNNLLAALFNAFAAGTFFYIGTAHRHHKQYHSKSDSHHHYNEVVAMIAGVAMMGLVGFFI